MGPIPEAEQLSPLALWLTMVVTLVMPAGLVLWQSLVLAAPPPVAYVQMVDCDVNQVNIMHSTSFDMSQRNQADDL